MMPTAAYGNDGPADYGGPGRAIQTVAEALAGHGFEVDSPDPCLSGPLVHLLKTAQREIDRHVRRDGCCAACGSPFPCERAVLAEITLGAW